MDSRVRRTGDRAGLLLALTVMVGVAACAEKPPQTARHRPATVGARSKAPGPLRAIGKGNRITGTFTGGTGRFEGATGEYEFQWQYVIEAEEGTIQGRAVGLKGRYRLRGSGEAPARGATRP
jgi:hypothetical protein